MRGKCRVRSDWLNIKKRLYVIDSFDGPVLSRFSTDEIFTGRLQIVQDAVIVGASITVIA